MVSEFRLRNQLDFTLLRLRTGRGRLGPDQWRVHGPGASGSTASTGTAVKCRRRQRHTGGRTATADENSRPVSAARRYSHIRTQITLLCQRNQIT